jgi:hypothetical protein
MKKGCGTGNPFANRLPLNGEKELSPRLFWAIVGSGLSLREGSVGWRFDCPRDPTHTVTLSYRKLADRAEAACYLCCHLDDPDQELHCSTLQVVTALGCNMRDLYQQPRAAADGPCGRCGSPGYRVAGVLGGRPICLPHLLDATHQPRSLLFTRTD